MNEYDMKVFMDQNFVKGRSEIISNDAKHIKCVFPTWHIPWTNADRAWQPRGPYLPCFAMRHAKVLSPSSLVCNKKMDPSRAIAGARPAELMHDKSMIS